MVYFIFNGQDKFITIQDQNSKSKSSANIYTLFLMDAISHFSSMFIESAQINVLTKEFLNSDDWMSVSGNPFQFFFFKNKLLSVSKYF